MTNIILCGGSGTRLWPLSRSTYPKQFVELIEGRSLFQATILRNMGLCSKTTVVTNGQHVFVAADQYRSTADSDATFCLEPVGRNTAPAIALACFGLPADETVLVSPSDHLVADLKEYQERVREATVLSERGYLVTFGIKPEYPETGYGYIEVEAQALVPGCGRAVKSFREKPNQSDAEAYVRSGTFLWNSGMFVFKAGLYLEELARYAPDLYNASYAAYDKAAKRVDPSIGYMQILVGAAEMAAIPSISIDYAVMERSSKVACIVSSFGWNDLGSFDALYDIFDKDEAGNTKSQRLVQTGARGNIVLSESRTVALVDVEHCIVVDTPDAVLVAKRGSSQGVKKIVEELKRQGGLRFQLTELPATVCRPWGDYTCLDSRFGFKVKRIVVKPGKKLSLQKHAKRSEHWVVARGEATVMVGTEERLLTVDKSVYIPVGCLHRLENRGKEDVVILETQIGEFLEEDDIVRVDDAYGRV